jgi:alcohol dehydrogenase class IV
MFPDYAIIDPRLTLSLPAKITAYTAFDALSHALEAFWSKYSNPVSDLFAVKSISLVMNNLPNLMRDLQSLELRSKLAKASLYAGLAFSNTKTTAVHAVSYPMTIYYGVPHGIACALTLREFLIFNKDYIDCEKLENLLDVLGYSDLNELKHKLDELAKEVHLPTSLKEAGILREGIEVILEEGFHPERVTNNPRKLTKTELRRILESIYE